MVKALISWEGDMKNYFHGDWLSPNGENPVTGTSCMEWQGCPCQLGLQLPLFPPQYRPNQGVQQCTSGGKGTTARMVAFYTAV